MIKFIATDMDGTLLTPNGQIPEEFTAVFHKLKENDVLFAAASGRQYYNLVDRFNDHKDDMLFIAENGTYVVHKGEEIHSNCLDLNVARDLIKIGRNIEGAHVILCGKKAAYVESSAPHFIEQVEKYYARYEIVEDLTKVDDDVLKVTMCDFIGSEQNSYPHFEEFVESLQVAVSGEIWLDVTNGGANKGEAIKKVQEHFGISFEETMVFGDFLNDLEMMGSAYHSYAMANAHDELKKAARFETKSNAEHGVLHVIKEHLNQ